MLRALLEQLGTTELEVLNTAREDVTLVQLAHVVRLERDKGMRGDGFEWAVHEAIMGGEPTVIEPVAYAMGRASKRLKDSGAPTSLMFGHERARYLGFLDAVVQDAGEEALLLPDGSGRPFAFDTWVRIAAEGHVAEDRLAERIRKVWKTDLFLGVEDGFRYAAATIKSNFRLLEDGPGLRIAIVPEHKDLRAKYDRSGGLHLAVLPDPDGFMGLFNDGYSAVARAVLKLGKQPVGAYFEKPSATAERVQAQLEKYPTVTVTDIAAALDDAAQQDLIGVDRKLLSVDAPSWLSLPEETTVPILAPRPRFAKLD